MFNKKFLSGILCAVILLSTISVAAATFSDVENDPTVSWAKPYITEMSEKGYIKGYEDGTFKPNNSISKTEALILLSRMIGVNDSSFADSVEFATKEFASVLNGYSTNYGKEVSFLLYAGILDEDELDSYISSSNKNQPLKRYEAAILLTKLLGAEDEVSGNAFVSSSYADTVEIPDSARAYVEYVKEQGIMQGMGNNASGAPIFSPNTNVTRSQMAKMLCTLIDVIDLSSQTGTVVSTDSFNETITIKIDGSDIVSEVTPATKYKINGKDASLSKMKKGMHVKITYIAGNVALIENQATVEDSVIYGLVASTKDSSGTQTVVIADANDKTKKETYILADGAKIRVGGAIDLFSKVKSGDYVALTIEDGLVTVLEVVDKTTTAYGTLVSVDISGDHTILNVENNKGEIVEYEVSADGAQVSRNSLEVSINALTTGDSLSLRMTYGKVTKIQASSASSTNAGTINYITHSTKGTTIGIETDDEIVEYKVNKSVKVFIDSSENASIYDLRPGSAIDIKLDSSEIVRIEAGSVASQNQIGGIIKNVNTTYGLLIIEDAGAEYDVYVNNNTKIIDSTTGRNVLLKNVEKNRKVSITGTNSSGVFEASVIVIQ
ncbi:MAG: S-layer homology domain-containing protein [Clostridia bacterium]|nr:S-layer homology domain-containing protein [Clostridia bacterium]